MPIQRHQITSTSTFTKVNCDFKCNCYLSGDFECNCYLSGDFELIVICQVTLNVIVICQVTLNVIVICQVTMNVIDICQVTLNVIDICQVTLMCRLLGRMLIEIVCGTSGLGQSFIFYLYKRCRNSRFVSHISAIICNFMWTIPRKSYLGIRVLNCMVITFARTSFVFLHIFLCWWAFEKIHITLFVMWYGFSWHLCPNSGFRHLC